MSKIRIAVLRGGPSPNYAASLETGNAVLHELPEQYEGHDIFISKDGTWHRDGYERDPHRALAGMDAAVNALHGQYGEDGQVQKILDTVSIPYTGSDAIASRIGMNKILSKKAFEYAGIKTPYFTIIKKDDDVREKSAYVFNHFMLPFVVKPSGGSSRYGLTIVSNFNHLADALDKAFLFSDSALVEEYVRGREATVGIIKNFRDQKTYALIPVEIRQSIVQPAQSLYMPQAHILPAGGFSAEEKTILENTAKQIHESLGLRHYSHVDIILTRHGPIVLEVNTLPSFAPAALLPQSLEAVGIAMPDFLDHIIQQTINSQ